MTPSEIAAWHDGAAAWMESREDFHIQAATTILELEARVNNQSEIIKRQAVSGVNTAERLKIATEALEKIEALPDKVPVTDGVGVSQAMRYGLEASAKQATQALARIKELA